jgi:ATP-dependent helicase/nuclease subunit A
VENPIFHAINSYTSDEEFEEELRVLYVALTRARERLFIYGSLQSAKCDKALASAELKRAYFSPFIARKCKSFLEIILTTHDTGRVLTHELEPTQDEATEGCESAECAESERAEEKEQTAPAKCWGELTAELSAARDSLTERFSFEYPYRYEGLIPEKLSVSKLYPEVLDESAEDSPEQLSIDGSEPLNFRPTIPEFISGHPADESAKRGIATHMFMQFCDLEKLEKYGAKEELRRLVRLEFLSEKDGERVRLGEIKDFTRSPLFREMREAKRLYRELRFNLRLPVLEFTENPEAKAALLGKTLLTQGVIDCIIEGEDGSLHLIDYKTDRLTKEELENPRLGKERLRSTHQRQLSYYKRAILEMFGKEPRRTGVYSLHLGEEIEV